MKFIKAFKLIIYLIALTIPMAGFADGHQDLKNILLIGPPASGKGTVASAIVEKFNIPQISTGDLLRAKASEDNQKAQELREIMASGQLVPDTLVFDLFKERMSKDDTQNGYVLDGFPRTQEQAIALDNMTNIHYIIVLEVPDEVVIKRISGRRIHPGSGRTYHIETKPPKVAGIDDVTGEPLVQREDDTVEAVTKRLETFRAQTVPVIEHYKKLAGEAKTHIHLYIIDGTQTIEKVNEFVLAVLSIDS